MMKFLKIAGIVAIVLIVCAAALFLRASRSFGPKEYSSAQVREMCGPVIGMEGFTLTDSDILEHGWNSGGMDSATLCSMKTTPERVRTLKQAIQAKDGTVWSGWKTAVAHTPADCKGDEYACPRYGQMSAGKRPDWWPAGALPGAEWFSVTELHEGNSPHPHGVNYVISEPDGLVFAERWRT
ncbi:MAG: hypothetical protein NTX59_12885 [Elusimicrobia bacterium]|nr:hypothetical protein [Elusimicrobiota bacterium]